MNLNIINASLKSLQAKQSKAYLRKESGSSLLTLLGVVATIATIALENVPADAVLISAILTGVLSAVSFAIDRYTVPAITEGQREKIVAEVGRISDAVGVDESLPIYNAPSTLDVAAQHTTTE